MVAQSGFSLDYMHLACLKVTHKLLLYWLNGPTRRQNTDKILTSRLSAISVNLLFDKLAAWSKVTRIH